MRERTEDLGRLMVLIDDLLDNGCFDDYQNEEAFLCHYSDECEEIFKDRLGKLFVDLESARELLYKCLEIAKGEDYLNITGVD